MDGARFDALSRLFSDDMTRRRITRLMSGLALGGPVALRGPAEATAKKKHKHKHKKKCKGGTKRCGKKCIPSTNCCSNSECGTGGACVGGVCACAIGFKNCQGGCIAEDACCTSDECDECEVCKDGTCGPACPEGQTCLDNGSCAIACPATCPADCACSNESTEGASHCVPLEPSCEENPQECASTTECPVGQQCQLTFCGPGGSDVNRCWSLCTA